MGRIDALTGFVPIRDVPLPPDYKVRDVVLNGRPFSIGKVVMRFNPGGFVDRLVAHLPLRTPEREPLSVSRAWPGGAVHEPRAR